MSCALSEGIRAGEQVETGGHQRGFDHHWRPIRVQVHEQGCQTSNMRAGHGRAAIQVEVFAGISWRGDCGQDIYAGGRNVRLEDVAAASQQGTTRGEGSDHRCGDRGTVGREDFRCRSRIRGGIGSNNRTIHMIHMHGRDAVEVTIDRTGGHVGQDRTNAICHVDSQALVHPSDYATITEDDLASDQFWVKGAWIAQPRLIWIGTC